MVILKIYRNRDVDRGFKRCVHRRRIVAIPCNRAYNNGEMFCELPLRGKELAAHGNQTLKASGLWEIKLWNGFMDVLNCVPRRQNCGIFDQHSCDFSPRAADADHFATRENTGSTGRLKNQRAAHH